MPGNGRNGRPVAELADELKAEAERQLNVDSQRSLEIADEIYSLADDTRVHALGLMARADALRELGRYVEAAQAYEQAAILYRSVGDEVGWARTRIGATLTSRHTGEYAQALRDLDEARRILTEHELWLRLARLESMSGALYAALGRHPDALAAYERALFAAKRLEPRDDLLEAEISGNLWLAYYQVDDFDAADAFRAHAAAIFEREGQHHFLARQDRNYARLAASRGHYSKALAAVWPGRRALLASGMVDAAAHLGQVGVDCLVRLNRPGEAAELGASVAAEFESVGARIEAARTRTLRAVALAQLANAEAALDELAVAESLYGSVEWETGPAEVHLGRALVLGEAGRWQEALSEADRVRQELRRRGSVIHAVQADLIRARALRALGPRHAAADAAHSALELVHHRPLPWLRYHAWRVLAELAQDAGDEDQALTALLSAIGDLEQVQGRILTEYRATFLVDKVDVFEQAVGIFLNRDDLQPAFDLVERAKSRALVDALAGGLDIRIRPKTDDQAQLAEEITRLRREHDALAEDADVSPELQQFEQRISHLLEELRLAGADDLEGLSLLEGRVYSPQSQLEPSTALLEFFRTGEDLVVFVMDRQTLRASRLTQAVPHLLRLESALLLNLRTATAEPARRQTLEPNARALLQRSYDVLLRPIEEWLASYERLVIVPHGRLHHMPFGALHDGQRYLIERFEVSTAASASSLTFCMRPRGRQGMHALIGANSADHTLPEVVEEARSVAELYGGELLVENELTLGELKRRAPNADLIHLGAHGVARLDAPQFSYLRLADGHLTALDCFDLELDCSLVTLSACESGRGFVSAGDEQIGLPRAFLYAGARTVLYSLWRIDDRATRILMQHFYAQLRAGQGRAAALRMAQLQMLRTGASHPFLWAGLTLSGDWR